MQLPVEWVRATVANADADLYTREGFFLGIRAVTAWPAGVAFRLMIRIREENLLDVLDYRVICGHAVHGCPSPPGGLALRAQAASGGAVSECRIWPGEGGGGGYSHSGKFVGTRLDYGYWLPLPPDAASVELIAAWPDQQVAETRLDLDLEAIRAAADSAVRV